jgi:hypothetical protein
MLCTGEQPYITASHAANIEVAYGLPFELQCTATGNPSPEMRWQTSPEIVSATGHAYTWRVDHVRERIHVRCEAVNTLGSDVKNFVIVPIKGGQL